MALLSDLRSDWLRVDLGLHVGDFERRGHLCCVVGVCVVAATGAQGHISVFTRLPGTG